MAATMKMTGPAIPVELDTHDQIIGFTDGPLNGNRRRSLAEGFLMLQGRELRHC